ncbi:MAG: hypothetical protein Cons2KO_27680 [Congregibacter sp.]
MDRHWRLWGLTLCISFTASAQPLPEEANSANTDAGAQALESTQSNPAPADSTAREDASTLDDYEASEQISEDLSVSFPVDI